MITIDVEDLTIRAVAAALAVIDEALNGAIKSSPGPCGVELAYRLDSIISTALIELADSDDAPTGYTFEYAA